MSRSPSTAFSPSPDLIRAADCLLLIMARESLVREVVEAYETRILAEHDYPAGQQFLERGIASPIRDRKRSYLIDEAVWGDYAAKCREQAIVHNLRTRHPEGCPLLEAENDRLQAENVFLDLLQPITKIDRGRLSVSQRTHVLDLSLKLVMPFVNPHERFKLPVPEEGDEATPGPLL